MKAFQYTFVILLCLFCSLAIAMEATEIIPYKLLTSPPSIAEGEVKKRAHILSLGMSWEISDKETDQRNSLGFDRRNGKTILKTPFENTFLQELASFENHFTFCTPQGKKYGHLCMETMLLMSCIFHKNLFLL